MFQTIVKYRKIFITTLSAALIVSLASFGDSGKMLEILSPIIVAANEVDIEYESQENEDADAVTGVEGNEPNNTNIPQEPNEDAYSNDIQNVDAGDNPNENLNGLMPVNENLNGLMPMNESLNGLIPIAQTSNVINGIGTINDLMSAIETATEDTDIYLSSPIIIRDSYDFRNPNGHTITIYPYGAFRHFHVQNVEYPRLTFDNVILNGNNNTGGGIHISTGVTELTLVNAVIQYCYGNAGNGTGSARGGAVGCTWFVGEEATYMDRNLIIRGPKTDIGFNKAGDRGGGVEANHITFEDGFIHDNFVSNFSANQVYGGGVYAFGGLTMTGGTIANNWIEGTGNFVYGGGVCNYHGDIIVTGGDIINNRVHAPNSGDGGGIYASEFNGKGSGYVMEVGGTARISGNQADRNGGGVYSDNPIRVTGGIISGNVTALDGGGIYSSNDFGMSGGEISGNTASGSGGGVFTSTWAPAIANIYAAENTINGGKITDNTAVGNGGGVCTSYFSGYGYEFDTNLTITNSEIAGNKAEYGGGVYANKKLDVRSAEIVNNESYADGGGIAYNPERTSLADITTNNVTFGGNIAASFYPWELNRPKTTADRVNAVTHRSNIIDTVSFSEYSGDGGTKALSNGYSNFDIMYTRMGDEIPLPPPIDGIYAGDGVVSGTGDTGNKIIVTFPNGETAETIVDVDGAWKVLVPDGVELNENDLVTVIQENPSGFRSDESSEVVKPINVVTYDITIEYWIKNGELLGSVAISVPNGTILDKTIIDTLFKQQHPLDLWVDDWINKFKPLSGYENGFDEYPVDPIIDSSQKVIVTYAPIEPLAGVDSGSKTPESQPLDDTEPYDENNELMPFVEAEEENELNSLPTKPSSSGEIVGYKNEGDGVYTIFDDMGVPMGSVLLEEGQTIEEATIDLNSLIPLGSLRLGEDKQNPHTGDSENNYLPLILGICIVIVALVAFKKRIAKN